jgi:pantothenate kinase-related protein Tda10
MYKMSRWVFGLEPQKEKMKLPIPRSSELLDRIKQALTPNRLPLLIAIDGADGVGKSSLASWLAWQLGMPAIQLDLYLTSLEPVQWLTADLQRAISHRLDRGCPVIVDGVLLLDALDQIGRKADFPVRVDGGEGSRLAPQIAAYRSRQKRSVNFTIAGYTE